MPKASLADLVRRSSFSFVGTVTDVGVATMADVPVSNRTVVVHVDSVLHSPELLKTFAGNDVTVQLRPRAAALKVGESVALFTEPIAFGDSLAVQEIGRVKAEQVQERVERSATAGLSPLHDVSLALETDRLVDHATTAAAVVTGRVVTLNKQGEPLPSEHDPDWWVATIEVAHAEGEQIQPGPLDVLYANSLDVRWRAHPKPKAGQEATFILHEADHAIATGADYVLADADDIQPVQFVESMRTGR
jgi:hypothetical protein